MKMEWKVSMALVFAVLLQSAGALMWAGGATARIAEMEEELDKRRPVIVQAARIEVELMLVRDQLDRIEDRLGEMDAD